jgi:hypothetical protein
MMEVHKSYLERRKMKRLFIVLACLLLCSEMSTAQKGAADPDYYPLGFSGNTWTGEVTAVYNEHRTLTLTYTNGGKSQTFVASMPDAPYERGRDAHNFRVIDFPYDKESKYQRYQYAGPGGAGTLLPQGDMTGIKQRPNPPASNVISDFSDFMGRRVTVYYTTRERKVNGAKEKYNDVWRIRILAQQ